MRQEDEEDQQALKWKEEIMARRSRHPIWMVVIVTVLAVSVPAALGTPASAAISGPGWETTARTYPTNLSPGGTGTIEIDVLNVGAASSNGTITVTDTLPAGVTAREAGNLEGHIGAEPEIGHELWDCTGNGPGGAPRVDGATIVTCINDSEHMPSIAGGGGGPNRDGATFGNVANPQPEIGIEVNAGGEGSGTNRVTIAGGAAPVPASATNPIKITSMPPAFGLVGWDGWVSNADGTLDTQAGSHPYEATFSLDLANVLKSGDLNWPIGGEVRDIEVKLPPGFVGDPTAVAQCTREELKREACPLSSVAGIQTTTFLAFGMNRELLYNMVPPPGVPAEFATTTGNVNTYYDVTARTGEDYGLTTHIDNITQREIVHVVTTLWGVPGEPGHDRWRNTGVYGCSGELLAVGGCSLGENPGLKPFLTLPTSCAGPQPFSIHATSWGNPNITSEASFLSHDSGGGPTGYTGCEDLGFGPTIATAPDTSAADTPAGLTVEVKPPIGGLSDVEGLSTSDIQNTTVTLPEGLVINPGQAAGLQACQPSQNALKTESAPSCPLASKVGTVKIKTPLLEDSAEKEFEGNVYILQSNPPNLELLIAASADGVNVKLVGDVHLDGLTGRLTTKFEGTPELPFTNFKLSFSGGAQAALATPTTCGTYTTTSDFTPWASPFVADAFPTGAFAIISGGANGASCPSLPLPFGPSLTAGSTTDQAGGFTNFSLLLQAPDDQQRIEKLQFKIPQGLLGMISQVPLCPEPQASGGTCSSASQIGHTVVASGPGPYPLVVPQPGQPPAAIYLTGPYEGAPYGLSIVVPIVVGPFTLQTQIVRAKIEVDPLTAQITVTTDPFPQVIDGVPTDLRTVNAVIDRPGFMFNPTNCSPMSFSGTAWGTPPPGVGGPGSTAAISSHFQMGSCQALKFKPDFKVSTSGKTSRKSGASLDVKLTYPKGPFPDNQASVQSNIAQVKVDLPKQLPSRLTTLQKACTAATFEANPAACPAASRVGQVAANTPVLPVQLTGPAYFVSYGGAKFPELVFVLQGYGVTVQVHAETFISKAGITSSTLRHVPDVPITSFELKLPQGPFSALAANGNLCTSKLKMPTAFTAQNGAVIHQNTPISVNGCAKQKKSGKHHKGTNHRKKK
jgi:hypothetical protein